MTAVAHSVRVSRAIRADPATLFRAWTDPNELMHWWRMRGEGWSFAGATVDLRVGGAYRLAMTGPDGKTHVAVGVYREVEPPGRLVFTWDWEDPASRVGDTLVSVELNRAAGGLTEVVVTHERFVDPARLERHGEGWTQLLILLDEFTTKEGERRAEMTRETIEGYFESLRGPAFGTDVAEIFEVKDGTISAFDIYFDSAPFPK